MNSNVSTETPWMYTYGIGIIQNPSTKCQCFKVNEDD